MHTSQMRGLCVFYGTGLCLSSFMRVTWPAQIKQNQKDRSEWSSFTVTCGAVDRLWRGVSYPAQIILMDCQREQFGSQSALSRIWLWNGYFYLNACVTPGSVILRTVPALATPETASTSAACQSVIGPLSTSPTSRPPHDDGTCASTHQRVQDLVEERAVLWPPRSQGQGENTQSSQKHQHYRQQWQHPSPERLHQLGDIHKGVGMSRWTCFTITVVTKAQWSVNRKKCKNPGLIGMLFWLGTHFHGQQC